jgi:hypothetical protein
VKLFSPFLPHTPEQGWTGLAQAREQFSRLCTMAQRYMEQQSMSISATITENPQDVAQQLHDFANQIANAVKTDKAVSVYCIFHNGEDDTNVEAVSLFPIGIGTQEVVERFKEMACRDLDDAKMEFKANSDGPEMVQ